MKILMVGLGSIGQRHVRNIRKIYGDDVEISAYRVRKSQQTFSDSMQILEGVSMEERYHIDCYDDYGEALESRPDIVFITTITAKHMEYAIGAAKAGCDLFIEKPLSNSLESVEELEDIVRQNGNIVALGYQNRFHPCVQKLRVILESKILGRIISVETCYGERLTTMHRYEDYKQTYMAQKDMGGGCLLNLQIHDIDLLQWIFGVPEEVNGFLSTGSSLETDVEESAVLQFHANKLGHDVMITSRSDFFQFPPVHTFVVVGEDGRVEMDLNRAHMCIYEGDQEPAEQSFSDFQRNNMFLDELRVFMDCVKNRKAPESSLKDGILGLRMVIAAKNSAKEEKAYGI